ncbi:hypothetical protein Kpol_1045p35 [Vanderwaltozyma polyspora DSM 70294]|uniref:Uncharacterized protein n=1 Tax=Vanderwaltozyma polyspora (strain ATCC 22028 / DSM 70294 / BCRC 21397 / CBS 2163 / NBRC 10782 / NRRL Y-8283 / UCD 57-17) TaxID=436907 RepID=A7TI42_VANPO|nr:uncharacterized protein Kpol_1045p35 [Vanderwaltozyma polyspora DSM 70294]EDO18049.1 hypothetical protein Kpol_1045p35 [Vanderwaltozyma polyspora DSM 70294]
MYSTPLKNRVDYNSGTVYRTLTGNGGTAEGLLTGTLNGSMVNTNDAGNALGDSDAVTSNGNGILGNQLYNGLAVDFNVSTDHLKMTGMDSMKPLDLASQYIDYLERKDSNSPVLDERSYYNNGVNYNFTKEVGGLGAFTPFERQQVINVPDEILKEASKTEIKNDTGIFPEINRCWITIDNKLILWNYQDSTDYQTIDEIKHTILHVALVKPKKDTFVDYIKHLLIVVTPFDIFIFAISYNNKNNELSIYNTSMSVSVHGLEVFDVVTYDRTGQIFFAGKTNGINIWELQYSGSDDWYNSKCTKVCMTQSALSSLLPTNMLSKIPGSSYVQSLFEEDSKYSQETIMQLAIDQSRGIIYSLSSKSIIRAYLISNNSLVGPMSIEPAYIKRIIGTTTARGAAILANKYLKISKIVLVSQQENNNLFFVAITIGGVRLYFNGSIGRSSIEAIRLESIKFPPSSVTPQVIQQELQKEQLEQQKKSLPFYSALTSSESVLLRFQKKSSVLLETTKASTIISPGIFFSSIVKTPEQDKKNNNTTTNNNSGHINQIQNKLFVSVPDYGVLKQHGKYIENATFLDTTGPVKQVIPLTASFNATMKQEGYANVFATQYTVENLRIAVLTNTAIEIYRYRSPDEIFESLIDNPLPFLVNYGLSEACSTALYVACKSNKPDQLRSAALTFFFVGIPGIVEIKPKYNRYASSAVSSLLGKPIVATPQKTMAGIYPPSKTSSTTNFSLDDVFLSPRFYGIALLISRLFRDIWEKQIFVTKNNSKQATSFDSTQNRQISTPITGVTISKSDVDYYLSSISILNEFFNIYGSSISTVYTPSLPGSSSGNRATDKSEGVAYQAENTAISAMIKLVQSIKESLSFLKVLYEESEVDGYDNQYVGFTDIIKYLNTDVQQNLVGLRFKELFAPNDKTKSLIREILSSIINRNITRGASIEYTATALQERCGSFCSSSDILGFRAVEHLRKAKEIGVKDYESLSYHLTNAIRLFEKIVDDISMEKLKEAVAIMLDLKYFPKTIEFLLNMANSMDKGNLAYQYVAHGCMENDDRKKMYEKRLVIYDMVFETLIKVDQLAATHTSNNTNAVVSNEWSTLREESYTCAFGYKDKLFHYQLYDWLVTQNQEEKLLQLDTEYVLPYLQEKSQNSLKISNLLWVYHSKRSDFLSAASILYSLALSDFEIKLGDRIELLSRANGFCNSVCPPNQKQNMMQLAGKIQEIFDVASVQDDILSLVTTDSRIETSVSADLIKQLDGKFLPVNDLFNDFAVPLGYYEVCLTIFKVSDFRNHEEIMSTWENLFGSFKNELNGGGKLEDSINFINLLSSVVIKVGRNVHVSEFVFPVSELFPMISSYFHELLPKEHIKPGSIASIFINAGISYNKFYYILRDLIETSTELKEVYNNEMIWLIKEWYQSDRKLREIISYEDISSMTAYSIGTDPIEKYMKRTGDSI